MIPSHGRRIFSGLSLFLALVAAWVLQWEAGELMWGAWASSALFGWVYGLLLFVARPQEVDAPEGFRKPGRLLALFAFFSFHFLAFHYGQGVFLNALFPLTPEDGGTVEFLLYPAAVLPVGWPMVAATFLAGLGELREATEPSPDTERMLRPYAHVVRIQVLLFIFLFLEGIGLIRYAVYPFLIFYFFPLPKMKETLKAWFDRLDAYMNTPR